MNNKISLLDSIKEIVHLEDLPAESRIRMVKHLFNKDKEDDNSEICKQMSLLEKDSDKIIKDDDYYDILEKKSIKLQNRVSEIVKQLIFDQDSCEEKVSRAIKYYKMKDGVLGADAPLAFLSEEEQDRVFFHGGKLRVSLFEILSTIGKSSNFIDSFQHWRGTHNRQKPKDKTFFAGIIGYGCNLGIRKIAKISRNINQNELENTINWYFNSEVLNLANDKVLELIESLNLPKVFKKQCNKTHTSSDGQKFNICVESLNSNYSFKYFGKGKGVTVYSFIDESHKLFYSLVISSSEREAAYVIDGLMHNDVVQSDVHSTDTHGFSETIFGITHLLGVSFAPRIKSFLDQRLYSFQERAYLKTLGHVILPNQKINLDIIKESWDDILRFVTTIKLKKTSASQLFRRLNSYSRQHPLYQALREFGRIIKTLFLLKYIDNLSLRQAIDKQLNKLESSNKFGKAVFYGNNQEFRHTMIEEQLTVEGCKRLIENSIICWNYLYLSQLIQQTKNQNEKGELINTIKNGSVVTWHHVNLHGEYDFSEEKLKNSISFDIPSLLCLKMV